MADDLSGGFEEFERAARGILNEANASLARANELERQRRVGGSVGAAGPVGGAPRGGTPVGAKAVEDETGALRRNLTELNRNVSARRQHLDLLREQQRLGVNPLVRDVPSGFRPQGGLLAPDRRTNVLQGEELAARRTAIAISQTEAQYQRLAATQRRLSDPLARMVGAGAMRKGGASPDEILAAMGQRRPAGGVGGTPPPPPPPVVVGGAGGGGDGEDPERVNRRATAANAEAQAIARANQQRQRATAVLDASSQAYRKHGALTTEFIEAAFRGEAAYREWGYQIGATAAKFAGWTAVSIPVFAALDGVRRIGEGAVKSASGVDSLRRVIDNVDAGQAQTDFRALSEQFNVPIDTASDAVYRMGQVFHDQTEATEAAKAALYSFKTGEVDVETSTKNLIAVVQGFGLSGTDLTRVFDQVNQAQNDFGVRIADTEAGLAKASGAFSNAGGGLEYLLALLATGEKVTGRTGENIGTAVQRSVGFIQRPKNQKQLEAFGIDPGAGIEEVYRQAFEKAQGLQGAQLQQLATALSSPQYASYFVPILKNYELFQKILADTTPANAQGSAQRELNNVLDRLDERIQSIGNNLQRLGSNIAQSGMAQPFIGLIGVLDGTLTLANRLLGVFNSLGTGPELPIVGNMRNLVVLLGQATLAMRLLQRFGPGVRLGAALGRERDFGPLGRGRLSGVVAEPGQLRDRRVIGQAIRAEQTFLRDERQRAAQQSALAAQQQTVAEERYIASKRSGDLERIQSEEARVVAARQRTADLAVQEEALTRQVAAADNRVANYRRQVVSARTRDRSAQDFAKEQGIGYVVPTGARPTPELERTGSGDYRSGGGVILPDGAAREYAEAEAAATANAERARSERSRLQRTNARLRGAGTRMRASATGLAASMRGIGGSLAGLVGPFEIILAGAIIIPAVFDKAKGFFEGTEDAMDRLSRTAVTEAEQLKQAQEAAEKAGGGGLTRSLLEAGHYLPTGIITDRYKDQIDQQRRVAEATQDEAIRRQSAQTRALRPGGGRTHAQTGVRPELTADQINRSVDEDAKFIRDGSITMAEGRARLQIRLAEISQSLLTDDQKKAKTQFARHQFAAAFSEKTGGPDFYTELTRLSDEAIKTRVDSMKAIIGATGGTGRQQLRYSALLMEMRTRAHQSNDLKALGAATEEFNSMLEDAGKRDFERESFFARTQEDRDRAWDRYVSAPRRAFRGAQRSVQEQRQRTQRARARAEQAQEELRRTERGEPGDIVEGGVRGAAEGYQRGGAIGAGLGAARGVQDARSRVQRRRVRLRQLRNARDSQEKRLRAAEEELKASEDDLKFFEAQRKRERFENEQQLFEAQTQVGQYNYAQGIPRMRYLLGRTHEQMIRAIREYGRGSQEALRLIAQYRQQQEELVQEQITTQFSTLQSRGALAEAQAANPRNPNAQARVHLGNLQQQLAFMRRHRNVYKEDDINGVLADIARTRNDMAEEARQQAADLADARFDYLISRTEDPLRVARLELQRAESKLRTARQGGNQADIFRAMAERNRQVRNVRDVAVNEEVEDIRHRAAVGELTTQQQIDAYQHLLKTMKMGRDARRQIEETIYGLKKDLEQSSELELAVGNTKLPTSVEIRRLLGIGQQTGGNFSTTNNNEINVQVSEKADMEEFGRILEDHTSSDFTAQRRARAR